MFLILCTRSRGTCQISRKFSMSNINIPKMRMCFRMQMDGLRVRVRLSRCFWKTPALWEGGSTAIAGKSGGNVIIETTATLYSERASCLPESKRPYFYGV